MQRVFHRLSPLSCIVNHLNIGLTEKRSVVARAGAGGRHGWFSTSGGGMDPVLRKRMEELAALFVEARGEIEMAEESKGTTYFDEEAGAAQEAVNAALAEYAEILGGLKEPEKGEFQRSNGLKMEQLKAEIIILLQDDDH